MRQGASNLPASSQIKARKKKGKSAKEGTSRTVKIKVCLDVKQQHSQHVQAAGFHYGKVLLVDVGYHSITFDILEYNVTCHRGWNIDEIDIFTFVCVVISLNHTSKNT